MKIIFINPCSDKKIDNDGGEMCFGIAIVSACLKKAGFETDLVQIVEDNTEEEIAEILQSKGRANIYAFHYLSHFRKTIEKWSRVIKSFSNAKIVCGGTSAVIEPETLISVNEIDAVCIGEGDLSMVEFVTKLKNETLESGVENFWLKTADGSVIKGEVACLTSDLNELPYYDMNIFDLNSIRAMKLRVPCIPVILSRGCPYSCTYCANNNVKKAYRGKGHYFRFMKPRRAIDELKNILSHIDKPATFSFVDDTFNFDLKWVDEFCSIYKEEIGLPFKAMGRGDHITKESAQVMKQAGCFRFVIGVENGSYQIRRNLLKRKISDDQLFNASQILRKAGIQVQSSNMCGLPGETREDMLSTIKLNALCGIDIPVCAIFWPFRNTDLYDLCIDQELINESFDNHIEEFTTLAESTVLNVSPEMKKHIRFNSKCFAMLVYTYKKIMELPDNMKNVLSGWFDTLYLTGRLADISSDDLMIQQGVEFENSMFRDLEIPLLEMIEKEYGLQFSSPEISGRRI